MHKNNKTQFLYLIKGVKVGPLQNETTSLGGFF